MLTSTSINQESPTTPQKATPQNAQSKPAPLNTDDPIVAQSLEDFDDATDYTIMPKKPYKAIKDIGFCEEMNVRHRKTMEVRIFHNFINNTKKRTDIA